CFPSVHVILCMIAHCMSSVQYVFKNVRVLHHIFSYTKESCLCIKFFKLFKNKGRCHRMWTVIEREIKNFFLRGNFPDKIWEESSNYPRRFHHKILVVRMQV